MMTGVSFSPLSQPSPGGQSMTPQPSNAVQDAIRLLSLQLPSNLGPNAPSGVLGSPTALGPALGGAIGQQSLGRSKVMPVPQVNAGGDLLTKLLQALGLPSLSGGPAPAKVIFNRPVNALPSLGTPPSMADLLANITNQSTEQGGWNGPRTGSLTPVPGMPAPTLPTGPAPSPFRGGSPDYQVPSY